MGIKRFEGRLERLVEGSLARPFRSTLQPVEIGRRLTREMDLQRRVGPRGLLVAPNSFTITLSPVDPKIVWYASSPLYGPLYGAALDGSYPVVGNDTSLIAEPYFFSPATPLSKELSYAWTLNGDTISTPSIPNMLALHRSTSDTGTATLSVEVTSLNKLFQDSTANLTLSLQ